MYDDGKLQDELRLVRHGIPLLRVRKKLGVPARTIRRRHRDALVATPRKVSLGSSALPPELELVIHDYIQITERAF